MQEDFHYCLIKILAQESGFSPPDAQIIAYASQYADDAVEHLPLRIRNLPPGLDFRPRINGEYFDPICTAHRGIQYITGLLKDVQRKVYISFHFLPSAKYEGGGNYTYVCVPNGSLALELLHAAAANLKKAEDGDRTQALIQLGIALHTYADSWSHQCFSGRRSARDNDIERIHLFRDGGYEALPFLDQLKLNILPDIGHAEALHFPDQSQLRWKYEHDASAIEYSRDNTEIFLGAAHAIYTFLCEVNEKSGNWKSLVSRIRQGLSLPSDKVKDKYSLYKELFPEVELAYSEKEWRRQALRGDSFEWISFDKDDYSSQFYEFNGDMKWFYFHIAAYHQRLFAMSSIKGDLL